MPSWKDVPKLPTREERQARFDAWERAFRLASLNCSCPVPIPGRSYGGQQQCRLCERIITGNGAAGRE